MKKILIIVAFYLGWNGLSAQPFFEYNNRHLPQSHLWNPAFMPQYKVSISAGQTYLGATLVGTNLNNILSPSETPIQTVVRLVNDKEKQMGADFYHQTDLFFFGFRSKKSYFALNSSIINEAAARIPKDLLGLAFLGNGAYIERDAEIDFSGNRMRSYLKNTFSYGRYITNELTVGFNASLLNGLADIGFNKAMIGIGTDTGTSSIYSLNVKGALEGRASLMGVDVNKMLNDSNYDANEAVNQQVKQLGINTNRGMSFGVGATYRLNEDWRFSLSVQNLGSINWNIGAQEVILNETSIQWNGLDSISENATQQLVDSLTERFTITNQNISSYTTLLKPRYVLGAEFFLLPRTQLQAVVGHGFGVNGDKTFISANFHQEVGEFIDLRIGYSMYDFATPAHRLGLGLSLNLGPLQVFASVNDILNIVSYGNASTASGMFGFNINIGTRKDRDYDDVRDKSDSCRKTFGVISNNGCPYGFLGESMNNDEGISNEAESVSPVIEESEAPKEDNESSKSEKSEKKPLKNTVENTPVLPSAAVNSSIASNTIVQTDSPKVITETEVSTTEKIEVQKVEPKVKPEPKSKPKKDQSKKLDDLMKR